MTENKETKMEDQGCDWTKDPNNSSSMISLTLPVSLVQSWAFGISMYYTPQHWLITMKGIRESFHHSSTCLYWVEESDMESQELKSQEIKHRMKTNSILNFLPSFFSISQLPCLDLWRGRQSEKKINIKSGIKKLVHTMHIKNMF